MSVRTKSFDLVVSLDDNNYARAEESVGRREQESVREAGKSRVISSSFLNIICSSIQCVADFFDK